MSKETFEWDATKEQDNQLKHGVSFYNAQFAFADPDRIIAKDVSHSTKRETRCFCFGKVEDGMLTVRFTYRDGKIRIFGSGYWRKGKRLYDRKKKV